MADNTTLVETHNLTKIYGNGDEVVALDHVTLAIARGEFVAVMGPSGSGKSTLLNMLGALDRPTSGQVIVDGHDLAKIKSLDRFRGRTVGFIFQLHNLLPTLSAIENVEVPMRGQAGSGRAQRQRAEHLMQMVGLGDRMHHLPGQLSGGQRQRVAVARALANQPALILADEPTGALDSKTSEDIMTLLTDLNRQGMTVVIVTHETDIAAWARRKLVFRDGEIVEDRRQAGHGGRIAGKLESDPNLSQGNGGRIPIPDGERPVGSQTSTESGSDPDSRSVHGAVP